MIDINTSMNEYYVYAFVDPTNQEIFYIGKGKKARAQYHLKYKYYHEHNNFKKGRINKIKAAGKEPLLEIIEKDLTEDAALQLEASLIAKYGRLIDGSGTLTNIDESGQAQHQWRVGRTYEQIYGEERAKEIKRKKSLQMSARHRDMSPKRREEVYGKISNSLKGRKIPQEIIDKIKEAKIGYTQSEESNLKRSQRLTGRSLSEEHCKKISASMKGKPSWRKGKKGGWNK
jgi:hypothetical protein